MVRQIPEAALHAIESIVSAYPEGVGIQHIEKQLTDKVHRRTLQHRLRHLVDMKCLVIEGEKRGSKYRILSSEEADKATAETDEAIQSEILISTNSEEIRKYVCQPFVVRKPVGYDRNFIESYRPNSTVYLSENERAHLEKIGKPEIGIQPSGTFAKQIMSRLLIDLSWNSSRLEGNTYSMLETRRLIEFGKEAEGKNRVEAQMIINHKEAIEFLVDSAEEIKFNRYTIFNLHALLANNLLPDQAAGGRLRHIPVGIGQSRFLPLEAPQIIEECFEQILVTATAIRNPFEQALFIMVQIPYLQPFEDVNKRLSRLAANISFIKSNLMPLSFIGVPMSTYVEAILGVYELNRIDLLKDVFIWAYEQSALQYAAVRQSIGEPDPFRLKHRSSLLEVIGEIIRGPMNRISALNFLINWVAEKIEADEQERFQEEVESELLGLHEGNFARYRIRPSEFLAWQHVWAKKDV